MFSRACSTTLTIPAVVPTYEVDGSPNFSGILYGEINRAAAGEFPYTASGTAGAEEDYDFSQLNFYGAQVRKGYTGRSYKMFLLDGQGYKALVEFRGGRANGGQLIYVYAAGISASRATLVVESIISQIPAPKPVMETDVQISVWMMGADGPYCRIKTISVPTWDEVSQNYPGKVGETLTDVMQAAQPVDQGKVILWHGEPGTGKTSAIRTLMREWKSWCTFHYITDPEKMFSIPTYLLEVGVDNEHRLVICEDTGQFLKTDASETSGAAMGRLLNFSDGILGQGSSTLFLLTTNEDLSRLHPAITRPGRCYNNLEFRRFTAAESAAWMGTDIGAPISALTLAELIDRRKSLKSLQLESVEV